MRITSLGQMGMMAAVAAGIAAVPAAAETLEERVAALEAREAAAAAPVSPTGFNLTFYGMVKGDLIYDNNYDLGNATTGIAAVTGATPEDSSSRAHAYQSRIGVKGSQMTDMGELKFNIEGDFFGSGGGNFRLRHAYGELGGLLAGQTWSLFTPVSELPALIDFHGQSGQAGYRSPQVRYTYVTGNTSAAFAVEQDYSNWGGRVALVGALTQKFDWGSVKLAGISRKLDRLDGGEASSWGATISANAKPWKGGLVQASYTTGEGIASLLPYGGYAGQQATATSTQTFYELDANGKAIGTKGVALAVSHEISPLFEVGAAYGVSKYDEQAGALPTGTDRLSALHFNVKYKPVKPVVLGAEYIRSERRQYDGAKFDDDRIQLSAAFNF
ncbi:DcaP family trimeric outer membrane transporter [Paracoccus sp. J39]|uniref:DcaP family trimeric outer membrane transporter n=1 Tax=Paracoccus sp. J39 TaxID=935848 RepID=UPI0012EBF404|nr:DcaP family trimeric outer membrane transporter [Paracoccus sp. J39]